MKFRKNRKGFTIVELIIVIAVIGVLTAVLVPTIVHLVNKANRASDQSLVSNLNKSLAMRNSEAGENCKTMHEAVESLEPYGYKLDALVTKGDQDLLFNLNQNKFYLADSVEGEAKDLWKIQKDIADQTYNIYAGSQFNITEVTGLTVGFDAGYHEDLTLVSYENETKDGLVRTNGGLFKVDADQASVTHYGFADKVLIERVKGASYHEEGQAINIEIKKGRVEIAGTAKVETVVVSGNDVKVDSKNETVEVKVADGVTGAEVTGVTPVTVKLVDSLSGLAANDNVVLNKDLTGRQYINVSNVTIDLNGHSITYTASNDYAFVVDGATGNKLCGAGLIKATRNCGIAVNNGGELTIKDITVEAQECAAMALSGSKLTINSGKFVTVDNFVIGTNGSTGKGLNTITINGGEFVGRIKSAGYIACGIYAANNDTWKVNGGKFDITNGCGILARSGNVTVEKDVVIDLHNDADNPVQGKVGDSKVMVLTGAHIVRDLAANYPGGDPEVHNNSSYNVTLLEEYNN